MAWKLTPEADAEIMKWLREQTRREYRMKNYNDILSGILEDIFKNNQAFNQGKERIRVDEDLSTQGKNAALARLYEHHSKKHQELKEKLEKERESPKKGIVPCGLCPFLQGHPSLQRRHG